MYSTLINCRPEEHPASEEATSESGPVAGLGTAGASGISGPSTASAAAASSAGVGKAGDVTIEAKPQIKRGVTDVTRFLPAAVAVRREQRDRAGRLIPARPPGAGSGAPGNRPGIAPRAQGKCGDFSLNTLLNYVLCTV